MITNVKGPHFDKSRNFWRIRWKEDGTNRTKAIRSEEEAKQFALGLRGQVPRTPADHLKSFNQEPSDGDAVAWCNLLKQRAFAINEGIQNGVLDELQASRVIGSLAAANSRLLSYDALERKTAHLQKKVEEIMAARARR